MTSQKLIRSGMCTSPPKSLDHSRPVPQEMRLRAFFDEIRVELETFFAVEKTCPCKAPCPDSLVGNILCRGENLSLQSTLPRFAGAWHG